MLEFTTTWRRLQCCVESSGAWWLPKSSPATTFRVKPFNTYWCMCARVSSQSLSFKLRRHCCGSRRCTGIPCRRLHWSVEVRSSGRLRSHQSRHATWLSKPPLKHWP